MKQQQQSKPTNRHGFQFNFGINFYQLSAALIYILKLVIAFLVILEFQDYYYIQLLTVQIILSVIVVVFWFVCTRIDPTDQEIYLQRDLKKNNTKYVTKLDNYCKTCQAFVNEKSKHCAKCNRCTSNFDHHCIWLNNCIGNKNYKEFIILITVLEIQLFYEIVISILGLVEQHNISYFLIVLVVIVILPITMLFIMHCYFLKKGISTYDYVMIQRERIAKQEQNKIIDAITTNNIQTNIVSQNYFLQKPNIKDLDPPKQIEWDQEECQIIEFNSYRKELPLPSLKSSGRSLDSNRKTCPNTKRLSNHSSYDLSLHKPIKSLFNMREIHSMYQDNIAKDVQEGSIIHIDNTNQQ